MRLNAHQHDADAETTYAARVSRAEDLSPQVVRSDRPPSCEVHALLRRMCGGNAHRRAPEGTREHRRAA